MGVIRESVGRGGKGWEDGRRIESKWKSENGKKRKRFWVLGFWGIKFNPTHANKNIKE